MSLLFSALVALLLQLNPSVVWKAAVHHTEGDRYQLVVTGQIGKDYYVHPMSDPHVGTELEVTATDRVSPDGKPVEEYTPSEYKGAEVVTGTYVLRQELQLSGSGKLKVEGNVVWSACSGDYCQMPEEYSFSVPVEMPGQAGHDGGAGASLPAPTGNLWSLILEAILWGFLMLLTPCVFPMVPMTVSFFIKQEKGGRFKALMYGVFIVLLYTVPICLIIGLTWLLGGETVTADIFNWLSTHWLPNILFFVIFMLFAASFFGAFEITLPSSWTTQADAKSDKGGLLGVFFLALTLVLVSFSCTGPIVGTVLIKSTQGEFWTPMVTMLAFSIAFSLPFALLAFFPSVLKKLPKSGGWLNSVKVVLGFVEVALGLKFLSTADQTYHWHLLDREVYLAIWIVCFALLGLYLALVIADFAFVLYLLPGMWGAPLKALSGYLPPLETQDFVIREIPGQAGYDGTSVIAGPDRQSLVSLPHGLKGYNKLEEGIKAAKEQGKKVFVDITGHGCVNCREMEARVWSDPRVLQKLQQDYVIVSLYVDDKTKLPESEWITTDKGKVLKDVGRVNSHLVLERFGVNSQPNYFLLDGDGTILRGPRGYNLDTDAFVDFLTL